MEDTLHTGYGKLSKSSIKGKRIRRVLHITPDSASPGQTLQIDVPPLDDDLLIVPGSLHVNFDLNVTGTKTSFMNNLSKLLQSNLQIEVAGKPLMQSDGYGMYGVYEDLWLPTAEREDMKELGICSANLRKKISGNDTATSVDKDNVAYSIIGKKQRIPIDHIIRDHGLIAPGLVNHNLRYHIRLPQASDILVAESNETLGSYTLSNIRLEFELIQNHEIALSSMNLYNNGVSLWYSNITRSDEFQVQAAETLINRTVNIPRKSVRALVFLFTKETGRTDSEEFVYPNIDNVYVQFESEANAIYEKGIPKERFYQEARRFFSTKSFAQDVNMANFYKDKFALVLDMRSNEDRSVAMNGRVLSNTQQGIKVKIEKRAHTGALRCNLHVVADAAANFTNRTIQDVWLS